ncbi:MAG: isopeptide-forming domain-containing fimbrial protein [Deltaproteobacteria bacterium]|nr:isopeptide-forming domain-containing fimbrial protein [Deltaproteobacteria bacterium]MBK8713833.1 isopeptide-forming domain-containing fimbrial protein [Deltaproteobacteria bacterium]
MVRRLHVVAGLAALGTPLHAGARPIVSPDDPALTGALLTGFDDIADASPSAAAFVLGETLVTIEAAAPPPGDILQCNAPGDCDLTTYMTAPVTITFDPPVAAIGMTMWYSVGPFAMIVTGANATEVLDDVSLGWQHPDGSYAGAADLGAITSVQLTAQDYSTYWEDLRIVEGDGIAAGTDLSLSASGSASVAAAAPFEVALQARNLGPATATAVRIVALLPADVSLDTSAPTATVDGLQASFAMGDLATGAGADVSMQLTSPATMTCDDRLRTIAVLHHAAGDAAPGDNVAAIDSAFDRSSAPSHEDCSSPGDDDCDGLVNCVDDDCSGSPACPRPLPPEDLGQQPFPPNLPWVDVPEDPLEQLRQFSDPWDIPVMHNECEVSDNHGATVLRPAMCCGPAPSIASERPSYAQWLNACTPIDPNFKSAIPATNALGFGTTAAGETIEYTVTFENIGGVDALDVVVLDVLSPELDDTSLLVDDGGRYDPQTRTLTWIDPVLPPHEPHTVHYSVAVRDDAPLGTRVHNTATIVFQDAVPPSRVDTPPLVHVIPDPTRRVRADLRIAACEPTADGHWAVSLVNAGLAPAYDASARIVAAPDAFVVVDDRCAFAHPDDPNPSALAFVAPWSSTAAIDDVVFTAPADLDDPCAELTWEITYVELDGSEFTVQSRLEPAGAGSSDDGGSGEGSGGAATGDTDGCACRVDDRHDAQRTGGRWAMLVLLVTLAPRARRRLRRPSWIAS